jgi:DNA-directed RNA polymerase beta subunit
MNKTSHTNKQVRIMVQDDVLDNCGDMYASRHGQRGTISDPAREGAIYSYPQVLTSPSVHAGMRRANYDKLSSDGLAPIGILLKTGEVVIGKSNLVPNSSDSNNDSTTTKE